MPPGKQCYRCTKLFQPDEAGGVTHLREHVRNDKAPASPAELLVFDCLNCDSCRLPWPKNKDGSMRKHQNRIDIGVSPLPAPPPPQ